MREAGMLPAPPASVPDPPRPDAPLVEVRSLGHSYARGRHALADVTLSIGAGEFVAVIGRNGSGKTTLVKHLIGLLTPTTGEVRLGGRPVAELPLEDLAQRVGYVFQDPDHQLFAATVADEVAFGPRSIGFPPAEVDLRVAEALAATDLTDRDADPFLLDKGVRQRLAVAAVLALRPRILVLDEPMTGLDHPEQLRMLSLLRSLHAAGRTILIVTHTPWVIAEHAERVLLLEAGRLRFDGPPRRFFADDALVAAAAFRPPEVTRLGRLLGCTPLSVDELVSWTRRPEPSWP
jgi:energy-coupling factor transport system ATP-binding protein